MLARRNKIGADYIEFVLLTGLRKNEAAGMRWENVDFDELTFKIPDTKNKQVHRLPITDQLLVILQRRKDRAEVLESPWVFPAIGFKGTEHLVEPASLVKEAATRSVKFKLHDLRRTFAGVAQYKAGVDNLTLKRLLNHSTKSDVTAGYVVPNCEALRKPLTKINNYFAAQKAAGLKLP